MTTPRPTRQRIAALLSLMFVVGLAPSWSEAMGTGHSRPTKIIDEAHCVTDPVPDRDVPSDVAANFAMGSPVFGDDALWSVAADRSWFEHGGMGDRPGDAVAGLKLGWYRTERGHVEVTVELLPSSVEQVEANATWDPPDGSAAVLEGYGLIGFQVSGIEFPDYGCWMITGELISPEDGPRRVISTTSFFIWVPERL